jgi:DNA-binding transcriptional regulator YiaG
LRAIYPKSQQEDLTAGQQKAILGQAGVLKGETPGMIKKRDAVKHRTSTEGTALGRSLVRGVRQAVAYERGDMKGRVEVYDVPPAVEVRKIRERTGLSPGGFCESLRLQSPIASGLGTGRRTPDSAARAYLLLANNPAAVHKSTASKGVVEFPISASRM